MSTRVMFFIYLIFIVGCCAFGIVTALLR